MVNQAKALYQALVTIVSRERLEEDNPPPPVAKEGFFAWLFKAEDLPKAAVSVAPPRSGFFSWLLRPDEGPPEEEDLRPRKPSIFAVIFSRDLDYQDEEG